MFRNDLLGRRLGDLGLLGMVFLIWSGLDRIRRASLVRADVASLSDALAAALVQDAAIPDRPYRWALRRMRIPDAPCSVHSDSRTEWNPWTRHARLGQRHEAGAMRVVHAALHESVHAAQPIWRLRAKSLGYGFSAALLWTTWRHDWVLVTLLFLALSGFYQAVSVPMELAADQGVAALLPAYLQSRGSPNAVGYEAQQWAETIAAARTPAYRWAGVMAALSTLLAALALYAVQPLLIQGPWGRWIGG